MRSLLPVVASTAVLLAGCSTRSGRRQAPTGVVETGRQTRLPVPDTDANEARAIAAARAFLEEQPWRDRYDLAKPWGVFESDHHWDVFFRTKRDEGTKPFRCLIRVAKNTGTATHVPLK